MTDKIKLQFIDIQGLEYDDTTLEQKGLGGSEAQTEEVLIMGAIICIKCEQLND